MVATYSAVVELVDESVNLSDFVADARFQCCCQMCDVFVSDLNNFIGSLPFFLSIYGLVNPTDLLFDAFQILLCFSSR